MKNLKSSFLPEPVAQIISSTLVKQKGSTVHMYYRVIQQKWNKRPFITY